MPVLSIVGGGFAGLWAAMSAAAERDQLGIPANELPINLISNNPDLVMRPRLYEGAKPEMCVQLQPILEAINVQFFHAEVESIIPSEGRIVTSQHNANHQFEYDSLILASGSHMPMLPVLGAKQFGFSIDTFNETMRFDRHIENMQHRHSPEDLTVVVVGASFTGIELVTELRQRLGADVKLVLLDQASEVGRELGNNLNPVISGALSDCNIDVRLNAKITSIDEYCLTLAESEVINTTTVVFATGLQASPLTSAFNAKHDPSGRLYVNDYLSLDSDKSVFIAGDVARAMADDEHATFMSCQHATELGRCAGYNAVRALAGETMRPYRQENYATCLDLGPAGAVFTTGWEREVQKTGAEGKSLKKQINQEWIYPPNADAGAKSIFQAVTQNKEPEAA